MNGLNMMNQKNEAYEELMVVVRKSEKTRRITQRQAEDEYDAIVRPERAKYLRKIMMINAQFAQQAQLEETIIHKGHEYKLVKG